MKLLFPSHPLKCHLPDPDYETEVLAARRAGFGIEFYNLDLLRTGDIAGAFGKISSSELPDQPMLHRGWMMSDALYSQLYEAMAGLGYKLAVNLEEYVEAHYLPNF